MKRYRVTYYFDEEFEVEASNEGEADDKAYALLRDFTNMIPSETEIDCLDEEDEDGESM